MTKLAHKLTGPEFAASCGVEMSYKYVPNLDPFGEYEKTGHFPMFKFSVTLTKGRVSRTFNYSMGCGHVKGFKDVNGRSFNWSRVMLIEKNKVKMLYETNKLPMGGEHFVKPSTVEAVTPILSDVLCSLVIDSDVINYSTFEEWALEFGYNEDSRETEKTYKACLDNALKLRQLIDIDAAREAFEDY